MPQVSADRNLLLGILSLQMGFLDQDALSSGIDAWLTDREQPLGQILLARQSLTADDLAVLESLVDKHLARHGNDPGPSLAAVAPPELLRDKLALLADPDLHVTLSHVLAPKAEVDSSPPTFSHVFVAQKPDPTDDALGE